MEDNVKVYLGKVLDRLKKETKFEVRHRNVYWAYPYPKSNLSAAAPYYDKKIGLDYAGDFANYCREVYGLTNREIRYVWWEYYKWVVNEIAEKKPISRYNTSKG